MASKLFINNSGFAVYGNLIVRLGDEPGHSFNSVQFTLGAEKGSKETVNYGDANNIFVDQLEISALANGGYIVSNQTILSRGGPLDDLYNTNDTIMIAFDSQSFVITANNSWT